LGFDAPSGRNEPPVRFEGVYMENDVQIEIARAEDAAVIAAFNCAMALETENVKLDPAEVERGAHELIAQPLLGFYLVAKLDGVAAGSLMVTYEWSDWRNGVYWWIQSVYVKEDMRRKGIYRKLFEHVKDAARKDPRYRGLRLYVDKDNRAAQATYVKLGMSESHYLLFEQPE
jgi:ribosomal protein S18 acetylase RimI-like enzyme